MFDYIYIRSHIVIITFAIPTLYIYFFHLDGVCPNKQRTTITTYRIGGTITMTLNTQQQSGIQSILFWTLINSREAGTFIDYTTQALQYFELRTDGKLVSLTLSAVSKYGNTKCRAFFSI